MSGDSQESKELAEAVEAVEGHIDVLDNLERQSVARYSAWHPMSTHLRRVLSALSDRDKRIEAYEQAFHNIRNYRGPRWSEELTTAEKVEAEYALLTKANPE